MRNEFYFFFRWHLGRLASFTARATGTWIDSWISGDNFIPFPFPISFPFPFPFPIPSLGCHNVYLVSSEYIVCVFSIQQILCVCTPGIAVWTCDCLWLRFAPFSGLLGGSQQEEHFKANEEEDLEEAAVALGFFSIQRSRVVFIRGLSCLGCLDVYMSRWENESKPAFKVNSSIARVAGRHDSRQPLRPFTQDLLAFLPGENKGKYRKNTKRGTGREGRLASCPAKPVGSWPSLLATGNVR